MLPEARKSLNDSVSFGKHGDSALAEVSLDLVETTALVFKGLLDGIFLLLELVDDLRVGSRSIYLDLLCCGFDHCVIELCS